MLSVKRGTRLDFAEGKEESTSEKKGTDGHISIIVLKRHRLAVQLNDSKEF